MLRQPQKSKRVARGEIDAAQTLIAPIKGWNARDPEGNMAEGYALFLDNWWPMPTDVQLRKGASDHVTSIGGGTAPVKSLAVWNARTGVIRHRLFACTDAGIYDATLPGSAPAIATALTDGKVISVNFGTTGGSYLFCVNGTDSMKMYDGTSWTTVASFSIVGGGTLNTSDIAHVAVFKRSLFFIKRDTMEFYYLPIDSIAGSVSRFPLGALAGKGGSLMAMATWTIDGGQGVDDYAVWATSEGQLIVYKGTDPSSSSTWGLQGVYDLATPMGRKCFLKYGGDLLYISRDGAFPLSKALQSTTMQATIAITDTISSAFTASASVYGSNYGWQGITSYSDQILIFNVPTTEFSYSMQFAMNTKTGAWCRLLDWHAFCWEFMDNQLYMGMVGKVAKAWTGTSDFGSPITCYAKTAFSYLGSRTREKHVRLIRPNFKINGSVAVNVALDMDYRAGMDYGPAVFNAASGSMWGTALWGTAVWSSQGAVKLDWITTATSEGYCAAVRLRVSSQGATVGWSATDLVYETGAIRG